ncbi:DNA adenine methylase [Streptomyces sennicomposti]
MRYVGGKTRIARWVATQIAAVQGGRSHYLEPFVGSGAVFERVAPMFATASAGDAHPDLMLMWQALADGWEPPEYVSREEYAALKHAEPSALRGFVGFGSSFSGKWFGGYVDTVYDKHHGRMTKPYLQAARASVLKTAATMRDADLRAGDYRQWTPGPETVVYCDPPYAGTLGYGGAGKFDTDEFLDCASAWVDNGALVLISEGREFPGWGVLAERQRKSMLRVADGAPNTVRREVLLARKAVVPASAA